MIQVQLTQAVGEWPSGTQLGFDDLTHATAILGAGTYTQIWPVTPPTQQQLDAATQAAIAYNVAHRLILGADLDALVPGPGQVVVGGPAGPVKVIAATNVLAYGATGDGSTDDTMAIRAAITAAGVNGTVIFPAGKTFLISGGLTPLTGQTWIAYGAILKRRNVISTTTTTAITTSGAQSVTVADASSFRVGMDVCVVNGASYDTSNHRILSISGNTLSLGTVFTVAFASGSTLFTSFTLVSGTAAKVTLLGFELDGNRANNTILQRWELHDCVYLDTDRGVIRDCYIHDAQADGVIWEGDNAVVADCFVINCQGNGIHLGLSTHVRVIGNFVQNVNLGGVAVGHADGCIIASDLVHYAYVAGNYCENGIAGIGSWDSDDDSDLICIGNELRNCTSYALDMVTPTGTQCGRVLFAHNKIYNCGKLSLNQTNSGTPVGVGPYRVSILGNYIEATKIELIRAFDALFTGNQVFMAAGDQTSIVMTISGGQGIVVADNVIVGGGYGVYTTGNPSVAGRFPVIRDNTLRDQYNYAIRTLEWPGQVRGNKIATTANQSASYVAIIGGDGDVIDGNVIDLANGACGIQGSTGGASTQAALIINNVVRTPSGTPSVKMNSGTQKNIVTNNFIRQAVSDLGTPNNTVTNNTTVL